jgi:hypothetical protein
MKTDGLFAGAIPKDVNLQQYIMTMGLQAILPEFPVTIKIQRSNELGVLVTFARSTLIEKEVFMPE